MARIAIFTPAEDFAEEWRWAYDVEAAALADAGLTVEPVRWTDAGDLAGFDLVMPLVAWGYHLRFAQWLALLDRLETDRVPLVNPAPLLRWNSDKAYLAQLARSGVAAVPTLESDGIDDAFLRAAADRFGTTDLVVKPRVSAGGTGTVRLVAGDPVPAGIGTGPTIVQPMLQSVRAEGEYSLILFGGTVSHCVVKRPKQGDFRVQPHFGGTTAACTIPDGAEAIAKAALDAAPAPAAYARVDLIRGDDGALKIMELELVEPALFLDRSPGAAARFAESVVDLAARPHHQPLA